MRSPSPLRYPGGKAILSDFLTDVIDLNDLRGCAYYEPYAGGAGAALKLLIGGVVSKIYLNDADRRVYSFWRSILDESDRFVDRIENAPLTIKEWRLQSEICSQPKRNKMFDVGFAAFYMNRCNRSGVLTGAGPIGGFEQSGAWSMDVRFYRDTLAKRVSKISEFRKNIKVFNVDAIDFLKENLPRGRGRNNVFAYLDPPYVGKGKRLYLNAYEADDHRNLARYLYGQKTLPWLMSYDDSELVRKLYRRYVTSQLSLRYTLQEKRAAQELIITPDNVAIPFSCRMGQVESPLLKTV